jgi:two-component system nitrogen regulation response regulator GlnG
LIANAGKLESGKEIAPMPTLLIVDHNLGILPAFQNAFKDSDVTVLSARSDDNVFVLFEKFRPEVVILATNLPDHSGLELLQRIQECEPGTPVIFIADNSSANTAIEAIERGAFDYVVKPLQFNKIRSLVEQALKVRQHLTDSMMDGAACSTEPSASNLLVGNCPAMQDVYKAIGQVASKHVNVLILGESGTGKELVAKAIQEHSPRAEAPFLAVNCAAIPETLLESELFGHEKGSFTGADGKRIGKFEQCDGGTLFLDEVGDMTPLMQSKLLRVLQEGRFERVGGNNLVKTDVRIIAATNRDLDQMVAAGQFRADLYYRLNVFTIGLPPLRERPTDLPLLIDHIVEMYCREFGKPPCKVSPEAMDLLQRYSWPGNVRELQSALICAMIHAHGPVLLPEYFPIEPANFEKDDASSSYDGQPPSLEAFIEDRLQAESTALHAEATAFMERILLTKVLHHTEGNQSQAALILDITRGTLRSKIRELGISIQQAVNINPGAFVPVGASVGDSISD